MFIVLQAPGHTSSELRGLWSRLLIFRPDVVCDSLKNYMVVQGLWRELLGAGRRVGASSERCLLELRLPDAHWVSLFVFLASHLLAVGSECLILASESQRVGKQHPWTRSRFLLATCSSSHSSSSSWPSASAWH